MNTKWVQVSLVILSSIIASHQQADAVNIHHSLDLESTLQQSSSPLETSKVRQVMARIEAEGIEKFTRSNYIPKDCEAPKCYSCSTRNP
ncbi:hypothetical protein IQ244_29650 [Nostoc sp. LEGE 06077]|uniref:hypothetical protein n=1 Tax=Nostoc sp. LEGE 06077 TaxID=915325 RepID=UPI001881D1FD|nr:hypothetical protein [Nostoc sp. LEGE 06077]MBE9210594.1 hypothetical protein [Nostoc sp. LEGE 06077]